MRPSQTFIDKYRKSLKCASEYYNVDSELTPAEHFDDAAFRLLIVFPSDVTQKGKSMTRDVINDFIRTACPEVFVDFCYLPCDRDRKVFDSEGMPYIIGNITHLDASHYDGIGFSLAINHEGMTAACMLATCNRCDRPIPLTWSERKDMPIGDVPLIWCGGMACSVNDICFGELEDGRQAFFDFMVLGEIYCERPMFLHLAQIKREEGLTIQKGIRKLWSLAIRGGHLDLYRHIYQPQAYRVTYDEKHAIIENERVDLNAPAYCVPYKAKEVPANLLGAARTIISGNGTNVNDARIMVASGCSGGSVCSFCHEGNYTAGYSELDVPTRVSLARAALRYTAADTFRPWAYNISSLSYLQDSIAQWRSIYPNVWFNNSRLDDIAECPELAREFAEDTGHIYAPIEGISDRIRNALLNKGVTHAHIRKFFDALIGLPIRLCKVGFIYTGYEEEADWDEFRRMHAEIAGAAIGRGAPIPVRYKGTMLVHYPHTALYYAERKAARLSYDGRGVLTSKHMRACIAAGIRMKMNGFKYSTFIEQAIIDLGRSLTSWFYKEYISKGVFVDGFRSIRNAEHGFRALRDFIDPATFFSAKPVGALTPVSRIHLPNDTVIMAKAREIEDMGLSARLFRRCLRSYGTPSPLCSACSVCLSKEETLYMTERELERTSPIGGTLPPRSVELTGSLTLRIMIDRPHGFEALNPRNTVYTAVAKLLQESSVVLERFLSVAGYSTEWMSAGGEQYPFVGVMAVDVRFVGDGPVEELLDQIGEAARAVNRRARSFVITSYQLVPSQDRIRATDRNCFKFTARGNVGLWEKCCKGYNGAILTTEKGVRRAVYDAALVAPVWDRAGDGEFCGAFDLPCKYSPWAYLQGVYTGHKIAAKWIFDHFDVVCVSYHN